MHSGRSKTDEAENRDGFDCGFLVPGSLNPKVRDERHGRYWSGLVLSIGPSGFTLFISAHFIHYDRSGIKDDISKLVDDVREESLQYWRECRRRFG